MIIGKNWIEFFMKRGWIYCNPKPRNVTEVSLDVTLGNGAWVASPQYYNDGGVVTLPTKSAIDQFEWIENIDGYELFPNELLIAHTEEFVGSTVPWITPQIRSRSTIARWGFEVGTAALFGEPGFHSRWALEVHNTSSQPIELQSGWRVGQMIFELTIGNSILYNRKYNAPEKDWTPQTLLPKTMD